MELDLTICVLIAIVFIIYIVSSDVAEQKKLEQTELDNINLTNSAIKEINDIEESLKLPAAPSKPTVSPEGKVTEDPTPSNVPIQPIIDTKELERELAELEKAEAEKRRLQAEAEAEAARLEAEEQAKIAAEKARIAAKLALSTYRESFIRETTKDSINPDSMCVENSLLQHLRETNDFFEKETKLPIGSVIYCIVPLSKSTTERFVYNGYILVTLCNNVNEKFPVGGEDIYTYKLNNLTLRGSGKIEAATQINTPAEHSVNMLDHASDVSNHGVMKNITIRRREPTADRNTANKIEDLAIRHGNRNRTQNMYEIEINDKAVYVYFYMVIGYESTNGISSVKELNVFDPDALGFVL